jgi:hypothetical protein
MCGCPALTASPPSSASCQCAACALGQNVQTIKIPGIYPYSTERDYISTACLVNSTGQLPSSAPSPSSSPKILATSAPTQSQKTQEKPPFSSSIERGAISFGAFSFICLCCVFFCCDLKGHKAPCSPKSLLRVCRGQYMYRARRHSLVAVPNPAFVLRMPTAVNPVAPDLT